MKCIRSTSGKRAKKGDPRNHTKYHEQNAFVFVRVVSWIVPLPRIDRVRLYLDFGPRYNPFEAHERLKLQGRLEDVSIHPRFTWQQRITRHPRGGADFLWAAAASPTEPPAR